MAMDVLRNKESDEPLKVVGNKGFITDDDDFDEDDDDPNAFSQGSSSSSSSS